MKVSLEKMSNLNEAALDWKVVKTPEDLIEFEL